MSVLRGKWCSKAGDELSRNTRPEIEVEEALIPSLKRQKTGLMPKVLTGEWRVPTEKDAAIPALAADEGVAS